jgi:hypothetical protein
MMHAPFRGALLILLDLLSMPALTCARPATANAVACYKSSIKELLTFYGNSMDTFTLYDGTRSKVPSSEALEYTPIRYRNVFICPSEDLLAVDKRAIAVSRLNQ